MSEDSPHLQRRKSLNLFSANIFLMQPTVKVTPKCVKQKVIIQWIEKELEEEKAWKSLPFVLTLLALFILMVNSHLAQSLIRGVEQSLSSFIATSPSFGYRTGDTIMGHKIMKDVSSIADIYSWLNQGLFPVLHEESFTVSETLQGNTAYAGIKLKHEGYDSPSPQDGDFLRHNTIVGSVRLQQSTAPLTECDIPESFAETSPCYKSSHYFDRPTTFDALPLFAVDADRVEYFPLSKSLAEWVDTTKDMELGCAQTGGTCLCTTCGNYPWIDPATTQVEITFVSLNAEFGLWSVVNVNFFFSRTGRIWGAIGVQSQWVDPYERGWYIVAEEVLWFAMNMFILGQVLWDIATGTKQAGGMSHLGVVTLTFFAQPWNIVDLIKIVVAFAILGMWSVHYSSTRTLCEEFATKYSSFADPEQAGRFFLDVEGIFLLERYIRLLFTLYAFVIVFRLFKGFAAQPRLALVSRTVALAAVDLVHFLLVFVSIFFTFGLAGMALFGKSMVEFSTFGLSINTLYRTILGDFMWDEMAVVGNAPAGTFFWTFTIIVVVVMLNMLLSAVLEAYNEAKAQQGSAETLWSQGRESFSRWWGRRKKQRVGLPFVWKCLVEGAPDSPTSKKVLKRSFTQKRAGLISAAKGTMLTLEDMLKRVPGLKAKEACEILTEAAADPTFAEEGEQEEALEDVLETCAQHYEEVCVSIWEMVAGLDKELTALQKEIRSMRVREVGVGGPGDRKKQEGLPGHEGDEKKLPDDGHVVIPIVDPFAADPCMLGITERLDALDDLPFRVRAVMTGAPGWATRIDDVEVVL